MNYNSFAIDLVTTRGKREIGGKRQQGEKNRFRVEKDEKEKEDRKKEDRKKEKRCKVEQTTGYTRCYKFGYRVIRTRNCEFSPRFSVLIKRSFTAITIAKQTSNKPVHP